MFSGSGKRPGGWDQGKKRQRRGQKSGGAAWAAAIHPGGRARPTGALQPLPRPHSLPGVGCAGNKGGAAGVGKVLLPLFAGKGRQRAGGGSRPRWAQLQEGPRLQRKGGVRGSLACVSWTGLRPTCSCLVKGVGACSPPGVKGPHPSARGPGHPPLPATASHVLCLSLQPGKPG